MEERSGMLTLTIPDLPRLSSNITFNVKVEIELTVSGDTDISASMPLAWFVNKTATIQKILVVICSMVI